MAKLTRCTFAVVEIFCGNSFAVVSQAMDNSHVSLVSVSLRADGFDKFRWRNLVMKSPLFFNIFFSFSLPSRKHQFCPKSPLVSFAQYCAFGSELIWLTWIRIRINIYKNDILFTFQQWHNCKLSKWIGYTSTVSQLKLVPNVWAGCRKTP